MKQEEKIELMTADELLKKEWNRAVIRHVKRLREIKKPSPDFPETIERACEQYFTICEEDGVKPSVSGLAIALGVRREQLLDWVNGKVSTQCADVITYYFSLLEIFDETALKENKTNAVAGIFLGKQNYGYKDVVEVHHVEEKETNIEEIEAKYRARKEIVEGRIKPPAEIETTEESENED